MKLYYQNWKFGKAKSRFWHWIDYGHRHDLDLILKIVHSSKKISIYTCKHWSLRGFLYTEKNYWYWSIL